jgi:hypothetical protein
MRIVVSRLCPIMLAAVIVLSGKPDALALDGYYMGQWAADKQACDAKASANKIILQQTDLLTPQLRCKLMGLRQDDGSGTTFVAHCSDMTTTWNDEITMKADSTQLVLRLRTDGREMRLVRCNPSTTTLKR